MISIAKYDAQVGRALCGRGNGPCGRVIVPLGQNIAWPPARAVVRYAIYPAQILALPEWRQSDTVLHITHESYAHLLLVARGPAVITCHDLGLLLFSNLSRAQQNRYKDKLSYIPRARLVIADSASTGRDLENLLGIPPQRIVVNYLGVDEHFRRLGADHVYSAVGHRLLTLGAAGPLALHVGGNLARKNIPLLLRAVAAVRRRGSPLKLVKVGQPILGGRFAGLVRELRLTEAVVDLGVLAAPELVEAYNLCRVLMFPSLYEGFGFPVLEAQACGLPCVLSNAASLPEVGGTAAVYHEADDLTALVDGVLGVLGDAAERARLVALGYQNVCRFSWNSHAERLLDIYARAAGGAAGN